MRRSEVQGKVIWRKPDSKEFTTMIPGQGSDEFIIAPFDAADTTYIICGRAETTGPNIPAHFFDNIALPSPLNKYSTGETIYTDNVKKAIAAIEQGQFEKVVIARQLFTDMAANPGKLFKQLADTYPSAFVYFFQLENGKTMIGATPETLLKGHHTLIETEALGGTSRDYGFTEKEFEEHRQIIRDIESKLSQNGFSYTTGNTTEKKAGPITHLHTPFHINGLTPEKNRALPTLLHPTAAICGLPFQSTFEFIQKHEDFKRGYYAGYLGLNRSGDFAYYVNLRCADLYNDSTCFYAGAGINKGSNPRNEWMETEEKISTLKRFFV